MTRFNGRIEPGGRPFAHHRPKPGKRDPREVSLEAAARRAGLPTPVVDYVVDGHSLDLAWKETDLAIVVLTDDLAGDLARCRAAALDGWLPLLVTAEEMADGRALALVARVVRAGSV